MENIFVTKDEIRFGNFFKLTFNRTVRIPDDGHIYNLPANLGKFPIYKVSDYVDSVPFSWFQNGGGVFIPMYQCEALWIDFDYEYWRPYALKIGAGGVNVVNGKELVDEILDGVEDYLVCPKQPWLDGFNIGNGIVRQFIAEPLGYGLTAEMKVFSEEAKGGIHIVVFPPKEGLFPEEDPNGKVLYQLAPPMASFEMGLGGGGKIKQKIYPDSYGLKTWDQQNALHIEVHIVNSIEFRKITGSLPPPTPISNRLYKELGLPWFTMFDDEQEFINSEDLFQ